MARQYGRQLTDDQYLEVRLENFNEQVLKEIAVFAEIPWCVELKTAFAQEFSEERQIKRVVDDNAHDYEFLQPWIKPTMDYLK